MLKFMQNLLFATVLFASIVIFIEARPQNALPDTNQDGIDVIEPDDEEMRSGYYEPVQAVYPNMPMDPLQMLIAQYKSNAYLRSPIWNNRNEYLRLPETKRQVRYRQCYFNPISCFKK